MESQFLESVRDYIRMRGYSMATEKTYLLWIRRFINFTGNRHPANVEVTLAVIQLRIPTVLTRDEVGSILGKLSGRNRLILQFMSGGGLEVN